MYAPARSSHTDTYPSSNKSDNAYKNNSFIIGIWVVIATILVIISLLIQADNSSWNTTEIILAIILITALIVFGLTIMTNDS
jgi:hypothetical protein